MGDLPKDKALRRRARRNSASRTSGNKQSRWGVDEGKRLTISRVCTVCAHAARENIDSELVRRVPYRKIAERFGLSEPALSRHLNDHLADYVQQALREYGVDKGVRVLAKLSAILERLDAFLDTAEAESDAREFVIVASEMRRQLELVAKLQGELAQEGTINIHVHPQWLQLRAMIFEALEPHPQARGALLTALAELEAS